MKIITKCLIIAVEKKTGRSITDAKLVAGRWQALGLVSGVFEWKDMSAFLKMDRIGSSESGDLGGLEKAADYARMLTGDLSTYDQLVVK